MLYGNYIVIAKRADGTFFSDTVSSETPRSDFKEIYRHSAYDIVEVIPEPVATFERIAVDKLRIETIETRNSDSLDFHDLGIWNIRMALQMAYAQGYTDALAKEV